MHKKVLVINIDPDKIKEEFRKYELIFGYIATFGALITILLVSFHTKANVSTFYASNCLGGWENPKYAENIPDVKDNSHTTDFSPENSAVLNNVSAQIFCGDYKGNIPEDALAKRFVVKFSILGSSTILPSHEPFPGVDNALKGVVETTNSENFSESLNSALGNIGPAIESLPDLEKVEEIIPEVKTEETKEIPPVENIPVEIIPSIETPSEPVSFLLNLFSKFALAQEVTQEIIPEAISEPVSAIEIVPELAPEIILEPVVENKEEEKKEIKKTQIPENNFSNNWLEVMYTLDGKEWKSLGFINAENIANGEFEIPFAEITWENLSKIQISISSVLSIDIPPIIYLDSVWIEAEYESLGKEKKLDIDKDIILKANSAPEHLFVESFTISSTSSLKIDALSDTDQGEILQIKGKAGTELIFTKKGDINFVYSQTMGDDEVLIPLYILGEGDFVLAGNQEKEVFLHIEPLVVEVQNDIINTNE